jgi:hypothetical protein
MPGVELLSVHIPKTGGTAFRAVLENVYGAGRVHRVYPATLAVYKGETEDERWFADSLALGRRRDDVPLVVHGHYRLSWYAERFPNAAKIAWLRHPVDRVVSFYYAWRGMKLVPSSSQLQRAVRQGNMDLLEFANWPSARDEVTRQFLDDPAGGGLAFIGIQERFDEDLERLGALLGWPPVKAQPSNVNQSGEYLARSVDARVRSEIARLNSADMALYEAVLTGRWKPLRLGIRH